MNLKDWIDENVDYDLDDPGPLLYETKPEGLSVIGNCGNCKHYNPGRDDRGDCSFWGWKGSTYSPSFGCIKWEKLDENV